MEDLFYITCSKPYDLVSSMPGFVNFERSKRKNVLKKTKEKVQNYSITQEDYPPSILSSLLIWINIDLWRNINDHR